MMPACESHPNIKLRWSYALEVCDSSASGSQMFPGTFRGSTRFVQTCLNDERRFVADGERSSVGA